MRYFRLRLLLAIAIALASFAPAARAVVVPEGDDTVDTVAPANDPGWNNVAQMQGASAVYLGNRWMITAQHVGGGQDGPVTLSDGRVFNVVPGSDIQLTDFNTGSPVGADLRMFELTADPGLPSLSIATTPPTGGEKVTMIGAGVSQLPNLVGWSLSNALNSGTIWTPTPLPLAQVTGFNLGSTSQMTWGLNTVQAGGDTVILPKPGLAESVFSTTFILHGGPYSAQATTGDSGGAVFSMTSTGSQLIGIMDATLPLVDQPGGSVVQGDQTFSADLSQYLNQITPVLNSWENIPNPADVTRAGSVSPLDALLVINAIENAGNQPYALTGTPGPDSLLLDANGDGIVDPADVLTIINALRAQTSDAALAADAAIGAASALVVPEPSMAVACVSGLLAVLFFQIGRLRRGFSARRSPAHRPT